MSLKIITNQSNYCYKRLKYIFKRNINYSGEFYKQLSNTQNPVIGNLPNDFIKLIVTKFPQNKADKIKEVQNIFAKASEFFRREWKKLDKKLDSFIKEKDIKSILNFLEELNSSNNTERQKAFEKKAGKLLKKHFSDFLPGNTNITIKWLANGSYNDTFLMRFINNENKDVLTPKVLKIYKYKTELIQKAHIKTFLEDKKELYNFYLNEIQDSPKTAKIYADIMLEEFAEKVKYYKSTEHMHGILAEANSFYYLQKANGKNFKNSNLAQFYIFDTKNKYTISDYIDKQNSNIQPFNFAKTGTIHTDWKDRNIINGVCVDMGGIKLVTPELSDPVIRRIVHKIYSQKNDKIRQQIIKKYENILLQNKVPDRHKIQKALEIYYSLK